MKIEIDFSKPDALRQMKRELEAALAAVDGALKALPTTEPKSQQSLFPAPPTPLNEAFRSGGMTIQGAAGVEGLFAQSANEFTSKEWIERGKASNIPESQVRNYIKELEGVGRITLIQRGQGRRPSSYRKN